MQVNELLDYNRSFSPGIFCIPVFSAVDRIGEKEGECHAPLFLVQQCVWRIITVDLCHPYQRPGIYPGPEHGSFYLFPQPYIDLQEKKIKRIKN